MRDLSQGELNLNEHKNLLLIWGRQQRDDTRDYRKGIENLSYRFSCFLGIKRAQYICTYNIATYRFIDVEIMYSSEFLTQAQQLMYTHSHYMHLKRYMKYMHTYYI